MGCNCEDKEKVQEATGISAEADVAYDIAVASIQNAMALAWDLGFREGAKAATDVSELVSFEEDELANLVEADAVVLDSVLATVQDLRMRLEFVEREVGLKYTG